MEAGVDGSGGSAGRGEEEGGRQRVSFVRPKHTSIDWACPRVEEVFPSSHPLCLPWPSSSSPVVLSSFVPHPPALHGSLSKAPNASGARVHVYVTPPRAYMWHGEGLLWRPTLGTGVKRHWPALGLDRTSRTCA